MSAPKKKVNPQIVLLLLLLIFVFIVSFFGFEVKFFQSAPDNTDADTQKYRAELTVRLRGLVDDNQRSAFKRAEKKKKESDMKIRDKKREESLKREEQRKTEEEAKQKAIEQKQKEEEEISRAAETRRIAEEREKKEKHQRVAEEARRLYRQGELFAWSHESCKMFHWSPRTGPVRLFDTFTFFNEIELLVMRLHTLEHIVDWFVLVESPQTFTLQAKKLFYNDLKDTVFARWKQKIIHIVCDLKESPIEGKVDSYESNWKREEYSRNCIIKGLDNAAPDDIILLGDVDEIPHPDTLKSIKGCEGYSLNDDYNIIMSQVRFNYNFFCEKSASSPWRGPICVSKETVVRLTPGKARSLRDNSKGNLRIPGGWHLSNFFFNDGERAVLKIVSFSHQEHNTAENRKKDLWEKYMKSSEGCRVWNTTHDLPAYVNKYPHLFDGIFNQPQKAELQIKKDLQNNVLLGISTKSTIRQRGVFAKRLVDQIRFSFPNITVLILDDDDNTRFFDWFSKYENVFYLPSSSSTSAMNDKLQTLPSHLTYFLHLRDEHAVGELKDINSIMDIYREIQRLSDFPVISGRVNDQRTAWDWSLEGSSFVVAPSSRYLPDTPCMEANGVSSFYIMRMSVLKQLSFDNRLSHHHQHLLLSLVTKEKGIRMLSCNQFQVQDWGGREYSGANVWGDGEQESDSEKERAKEEMKIFSQSACSLATRVAGSKVKLVKFSSTEINCPV